MRILITGSKGMLGRALLRHLAGHDLVAARRDNFDVTDAEATGRAIARSRPDAVIHCAGLPHVDRCEAEPEEAFRVNCAGTANVAVACFRCRARLIAISTDYVFGGDLGRPYHEWDTPGPLSAYGASKLAAEEAVRAHCPDHLILRTASLYGEGGPSFLHALLRQAADERAPLRAVDDLVGNPTSVEALAAYIARLVATPIAGTLHLSCEGSASRLDFAREALRLAGLQREVEPCTMADFPRSAPRPRDSSLDKRGLRLHGLPAMPAWDVALEDFLRRFPTG